MHRKVLECFVSENKIKKLEGLQATEKCKTLVEGDDACRAELAVRDKQKRQCIIVIYRSPDQKQILYYDIIGLVRDDDFYQAEALRITMDLSIRGLI
jgi:hypothetical protein